MLKINTLPLLNVLILHIYSAVYFCMYSFFCQFPWTQNMLDENYKFITIKIK